ncbi:MAG: TonB-dependent receptor, partial [Candidatus Saccharicenans sp.]
MNKAFWLVFIICSINFGAWAQEEKPEKTVAPKIEENILVTASVLPSFKAETARSVAVITREEIKNLPVSTVEELLKYVLGFDLQQRGAEGIQADATIRGGTFEQTLVLIDGFKVNDPQTGHNSLNLPLSVDDVDRVEILRGPGSRLFGPNAFSGMINIVTRKVDKEALGLGLKYGQHSYQETWLRALNKVANFQACTSLSSRKSSGYLENTDFEQINFYHRMQLDFRSGYSVFQFGFSEKAFGA